MISLKAASNIKGLGKPAPRRALTPSRLPHVIPHVRKLIPELADRCHVIASGHIGYGFSDGPPVNEYEYSFENLTAATLVLLDKLGIRSFAVYIHDYGAPIGLRTASRHPGRITALLVQSDNAYMEGFAPLWDIRFAHAEDRAAAARKKRAHLTPEKTHWPYTHGVPADRLDRVDPSTWTRDQTLTDRPGNKEVQLQLFRTTSSTCPPTLNSRSNSASISRRH
ncbi:alpha/beta fold hydrolase [Streptomyces sp. NPDC006875]|uniref:alpha/beta fold hydrolase n=1 Tax=Streptomyces sp. NPDC006875 TaxID=3154781 RepID=UPI0033CD25EE